MMILDQFASWAGQESVMLSLLTLALQSAIVAALGLIVSRLISPSRPDLRSLVLRQVLLVATLLPLCAAAKPILTADAGTEAVPTWSLAMPFAAEVAAAAGIDSAEPNVFRHIQSLLLLVFLAGSILAIFRISCGIVQVRRITRRHFDCADPQLYRVLERVRLRAGIQQSVHLILSRASAIPFASGIFRPTIVLPAGAHEWNLREVEMVIQHEAMHIQRRDNLWGFVGAVVTAIHWYNPLVRIVRRQMTLEAERCCDAWVVHHGGNPSDYARLLLTLARSACSHKRAIVLNSPILGFKLLEVRIMSILQSQIKIHDIPNRLRRAALLCTLLLMLPIATFSLSGAEPLTPPSLDRAVVSGAPGQDNKNVPSPDDSIKVDTQPVMLTNVNPVYPDSARKAGIEGSVWVQVLVDTSGSVGQARVMKTSGHKSLDDSAIAAALKSTFEAAKADGKKVRVWVAYEIKFLLKNK